jgi:hypothetical protein
MRSRTSTVRSSTSSTTSRAAKWSVRLKPGATAFKAFSTRSRLA